MAEQRAVAAREDRGHPSSLHGQQRVAERVHATTLPDQASAFSPAANALGVDPSGEQLPPSNHPMLPLGESSHETNGVLMFHTDT